MDKKTVLNSVNSLPENFDLEELFEKLIILEKIEKGQSDILKGNTFSHQEAETKLAKWLR